MDDYFLLEEEETSSIDSSDQEVPILSEENTVNSFTPRSYQIELFEFAKEHNSIMVLGTGSGKTFISILLIKELAESIRGSYSEGAKRTVFLVNTVPLVYQQQKAIASQTGYSVGYYEGSMNVDLWSEEKWKEELNKNEVLVMVAQIFKDLLLHRFISLDEINLLILDECHHATGSHPMREIMREYNNFKAQNKEMPRVMGLTACVLHGKCKENNVENYMRNLELVLDCVLVTSKDQGTVLHFTTKPQEMIVVCKNVTFSNDYYKLIERLTNVKETMLKEIECYPKTLQPKLKKFVSREIGGIIDVSKDLGEYILPEAISIQVEYLREAEADTLQEQKIIRSLGEKLENVLLNYKVSYDNILNFLSGKVNRLIEFFRNVTKCKNEDEVFALVFVKRRNTAKILCSLLIKLKTMYSELHYLKPESVVGGTFNVRNDLKVNEEILKQKKVIENFRKGLCNVIVSTSVLEEGIDIRKCNFVIRFNSAENFRAYVQSLGRARAVPSYFITLEYKDKYENVCEERKCYWSLRKYLMCQCFNRKLPDAGEARENFQEDEVEPPFAPFGINGARITFNSAIQLINRYCGSLPQDKFTKLAVDVKKYKRDGKFFVELTPPMSSPFRKTVKSNPMNNYDDAKKSAALEMCKRLFRHNLLDKNLLPKKSKIDADEKAKKYLNILESEEEKTMKGLPQPGTKKRRQIYRKRLCLPFKDKKKFYLYRVYFQHLNTVKDELILDSDLHINQIGFICGGNLNCPPFPLYSKKWGEVNIIVEFVKKEFWSKHELPLDDIKEFHRIVSNLLFNINLNIMSYDHAVAGHSIYIVPLTKGDEIDLTLLNKVNAMEMKSYEESRENGLKPLKNFDFEVGKYMSGVVVPLYRKHEVFYIIDILMNESPLTEFPESKKEYSSYKNYVEKKYKAFVTNDKQPLLECKHFSKEFNYLEESTPAVKSVISKHPKFIPELCLIIPLAASFCCQILCLSSVLHRVNGLQLEQEIYESVGYKCSEREKKYFVSRPLEYRWVEDLIQNYMRKGCKNLCLKLQVVNTMIISPGMILQALTPLHTRDNFNLERLEILGDSYLKFSVGNYLYCKEAASHEGTLTIQRSNIVCNKTLYTLAKRKGLNEAFQGVQLAPFTASPPGFYVKEEMEEKLHKEKVDPKDWISYPKRMLPDCEETYNPWTEQLVPDKNLADSVEALIGVYLLCGGEDAAKHFMMWLGLEFINEEMSFPCSAIVGEMDPSKAEAAIKSLYRKNCLDKVEKTIQYKFHNKSFLVSAFTHPSYTNNKVTDCYQRLEFLGDSILDYLITCHLFSKDQSYTPGQLTDLRSHYVKNETLARLAVRFGLHKYMYHMAPKIDSAIQKFIQMLNDGERDFNTEDDTLEAEDVEVPKALGDIVESLIGAVYQDSEKNMEVTWDVVNILLRKEFEETKDEIPINNVRALYEKVPSVKFEPIKPTDDEPAKCIVKIPGYKELIGTGKNKRTAKQAAAKLALNHLKCSDVTP